jgi:hypothetical protein
VGTIENNVTAPSSIKTQSAIKRFIKRPKRASKTNLFSNTCRLIDSKFDKLNLLFSFLLEACYDPEGKNMHEMLPFIPKKTHSYLSRLLDNFIFVLSLTLVIGCLVCGTLTQVPC